MRTIRLGLTAAVCFAMAACGGGSETGAVSQVQGLVAPTTRPLDHARAVAIGADGKLRWSPIDARGAFTLALPAGTSYHLVIANERASGAALRVVGHLVIHTASGPSGWIAIHDGAPIVLGQLHVASATSGGLHLNDLEPGGSGDSAGNEGSGDGAETYESESDQEDICAGHDGEADDDVELDAENDPGDDHADPEHEDDDGESEDGPACPPKFPHAPPVLKVSPPPTGTSQPR